MTEWTLCCARCPRKLHARGANDEVAMSSMRAAIADRGWTSVAGRHVCAGCTTERDRMIDELVKLAERCNDDELEVQLDIARRVDKGRAPYGPMKLESDERDLEREADEESLDRTIYRGMERVRARRRVLAQGGNGAP